MHNFFSKLEKYNKEYLKVYIENNLTMRDFALQCTDVLFDGKTFDTRLVKMKIWLHFTKILKQYGRKLPDDL